MDAVNILYSKEKDQLVTLVFAQVHFLRVVTS